MNHSKGPWSLAVWDQPRGRREIVDAHDDSVCIVGVGNLPTVEADARLISAAPELLKALRDLVEAHRAVVHCEASHVPAALLNAGEFAIAKAEGK